MKALWNNKVIAQAPKEDLIYIEGNWYFPPDSVKKIIYKKVLRPIHVHGKEFASILMLERVATIVKIVPGAILALTNQRLKSLKKILVIM